MVGKKRVSKFNISNKLAYTLIVILSIVLIGVGVYAYGGTTPATMGHSMGEIAFPACSNGQVLGVVGGSWACITPGGWAPADIKVTTALHNGNFGGYKAMYDWIQVNGCSGYHVCDTDEVTRASQAGLAPSEGWYTTGMVVEIPPVSASKINRDCVGWTYSTNDGMQYGPRWYSYNQQSDTWGCWGSMAVLCCKNY